MDERRLEEVCEEENFSQILLGNVYCSLAKGRQVECKYLNKQKDKNGLYPCMNLIYQENDPNQEFDS